MIKLGEYFNNNTNNITSAIYNQQPAFDIKNDVLFKKIVDINIWEATSNTKLDIS